MSNANLPSGCLNALQRGFNLTRGDFLGNPVFAYNANASVQLGGVDYAIPDSIVAEEVNRSKTCETTLILQTEEDYKTAFSLAVSASMSYGAYSMSASTSLTSRNELFQSSNRSYALNMFKKNLFTLRRNPIDLDGNYALADAFTKVLAQLPATLDDGTYPKFQNFFDLYGTHFLKEGSFGGAFTMNSAIDDEVVKNSSEEEIKASLQVGFSGLVAKGSISVDTAYSTSDFLSTHKTSTEITFSWIGGSQNDNKQTFVDSIDARPVLLIDICDEEDKPQFLPIYTLAPAAGQDVLQHALQRYLGYQGILGTPIDQDWSENMAAMRIAAQDGFVLASRFRQDGESAGSVMIVSGPGEDPMEGAPATAAGADYMLGFDKYPAGRDFTCGLDYASVCMPVRRNDRYSVMFTKTSGSPGGRSGFAPLFLPEGTSFGAWSRLGEHVGGTVMIGSDGKPTGWDGLVGTASQDGFLFVSVDAAYSNNDVGVQVDGNMVLRLSCNSVPNHETQRQSGCLPLSKGESWKVAFAGPSPNPIKIDVYWMPINGAGVSFGARQEREVNTSFVAAEEGFFYGYAALQLGQDNPSAVIKAYAVAPSDSDDAVKDAPYACLSTNMLQWRLSGSFLLPVAKGAAYQAVAEVRTGPVLAGTFWTPLIVA